MSSDLVSHVRTHVVAYLALFVALAGTSYAGIASRADKAEDGKIYACVTKKFGTLNLAGPGADCPNGQRLISWNEEGPEGDPGERGKRGKRGRRGKTGPPGPAGTTTGSVTAVGTGFGLTGGPITNTGTIAADPSVLQRRVTGSCSGNEAAQAVAEAGTVSCSPFVKQIAAGAGLSGGTITDSGALSVDPTQTQTRVGGTCPGNQAIQSVGQNGTVGCQSFTPAAGVLNSGVTVVANGGEETLIEAHGVRVFLDCTDNTNANVVAEALPANAGNAWSNSVSVVFGVAGGGTFDGNAAPPNDRLTMGSTTDNDRGDFDIGLSTGPNQGETLSGSFAAFKFGPIPNFPTGGCVGQLSGLAS